RGEHRRRDDEGTWSERLGHGASGQGDGSERPRVTRSPPRGNAGENISCGRKFLPAAADVAGRPGSGHGWRPLVLLGFSAGTALAEHLGERVRAASTAAIVGVLVMMLAFGAASSAIDSLFGMLAPKQSQSAGSGQDQPNLFAFQADASMNSAGTGASPAAGGGGQISPETMS